MIEIPGYDIQRELGHGGMARVYMAVHKNLQRPVALKVMALHLLDDPQYGERFLREARTVARLMHPHIVHVYDVNQHEQFHYIAMEYIRGGSLAERLRQRMAIADVLRTIKQIAQALDYAHGEACVHRDVKPDNILFRNDTQAILTDFGIAKDDTRQTRMTQIGMAVGTPHYMSPEQVRGKPLDGRSDIYSLGVVFFEALTGHVPFDAENSIAIGIQHITEPVPRLPAGYEPFQVLLDLLLEKDPGKRITTGNELAERLDTLSIELQRIGWAPPTTPAQESVSAASEAAATEVSSPALAATEFSAAHTVITASQSAASSSAELAAQAAMAEAFPVKTDVVFEAPSAAEIVAPVAEVVAPAVEIAEPSIPEAMAPANGVAAQDNVDLSAPIQAESAPVARAVDAVHAAAVLRHDEPAGTRDGRSDFPWKKSGIVLAIATGLAVAAVYYVRQPEATTPDVTQTAVLENAAAEQQLETTANGVVNSLQNTTVPSTDSAQNKIIPADSKSAAATTPDMPNAAVVGNQTAETPLTIENKSVKADVEGNTKPVINKVDADVTRWLGNGDRALKLADKDAAQLGVAGKQYQSVLSKEPKNAQALAGLNSVMDRYASIVKAGITQNKWEEAESSLQQLSVFDNGGERTRKLRTQLMTAKDEQEKADQLRVLTEKKNAEERKTQQLIAQHADILSNTALDENGLDKAETVLQSLRDADTSGQLYHQQREFWLQACRRSIDNAIAREQWVRAEKILARCLQSAPEDAKLIEQKTRLDKRREKQKKDIPVNF